MDKILKNNNKKCQPKRAVKYYSLKATKSKIKDLLKIAHKYRLFRNKIFQEYGGLKFLPYLNYPRRLRDEFVQKDNLEKRGLQDRQWKRALAEASGTLASLWSNAINETKIKINRDKKDKKFTEPEIHYMFYVLKSYTLIYGVCKNSTFKLGKDFEGPVDYEKCNRYLHRCLRKFRGNSPNSKSNSFSIDSDMYDIFEDKKGNTWFGLMSLIPRKRINIPLTSEIKTTKDLMIKIKGNRIEITEAKNLECRPALKKEEIKDVNILAVDKGYTELICDNKNIKYGEGLGKLLNKISDERSEINKKRNKLRDLSKNFIKTGDPAKVKKAKNIIKYNLGKDKFYNIKNYQKSQVKDFVNVTLNDFFKSNSDLKLLVAENLNFSYSNNKFSKEQRRRLSAWIKGLLKNRLLFKCQQNGVLLEDVNAAYTSQACPRCGYSHGDNRHGDMFHCLNCGFEGESDYISSLNILSRLNDPDIDRFTPYKEVKKILDKRFNDRLRLPNLDSRHRSGSLTAEAAGVDHAVTQRAY
jgi:IS605 OrfB family transposase